MGRRAARARSRGRRFNSSQLRLMVLPVAGVGDADGGFNSSQLRLMAELLIISPAAHQVSIPASCD